VGTLRCDANGHEYSINGYIPDLLSETYRLAISDLTRGEPPKRLSAPRRAEARNWLEKHLGQPATARTSATSRRLERRVAQILSVARRRDLDDADTRELYAIAAAHAMSAGYRRHVADQLYASLDAISYEKYEDILLRRVVQLCLDDNDVLFVELGSGVGRLLHQYASCISPRADACSPYRRAGADLYAPQSLSNAHRLRLLLGVDFEKRMLKRATGWFTESRVMDLVSDEGRMLQVLASARNLQTSFEDTQYGDATRIVCLLFQTLGNQVGTDLQVDLIRHAQRIAGPRGVVFVSVFNANAFGDQAPPYYSGIRRSVGQTVSVENSIFVSERGVYSRWMTGDELRGVFTQSGAKDYVVLDESELEVFPAYHSYIDTTAQSTYRRRALIGVISNGLNLDFKNALSSQ
jgi:hypothetical protein